MCGLQVVHFYSRKTKNVSIFKCTNMFERVRLQTPKGVTSASTRSLITPELCCRLSNDRFGLSVLSCHKGKTIMTNEHLIFYF